ncbi:hypothetical protein AB4Z39_31265 [Mycobacterium adipatum]|uniref:hypothetical protein n=1 Tax=Mycobacterium adipatum TaxID=1682113 RepID=UPI0034E05EE4
MSSRSLTALVSLALTGFAAAGPAHAEPPRQVTYTVTAETPVTADIYFRDVDPPTWADYSHNPYLFSPKVEVEVGPDRPWVLHTSLIDPNRWAMVSATSGRIPGEPGFHCELAVDGVVVATGVGPKGALCSLRHW